MRLAFVPSRFQKFLCLTGKTLNLKPLHPIWFLNYCCLQLQPLLSFTIKVYAFNLVQSRNILHKISILSFNRPTFTFVLCGLVFLRNSFQNLHLVDYVSFCVISSDSFTFDLSLLPNSISSVNVPRIGRFLHEGKMANVYSRMEWIECFGISFDLGA